MDGANRCNDPAYDCSIARNGNCWAMTLYFDCRAPLVSTANKGNEQSAVGSCSAARDWIDNVPPRYASRWPQGNVTLSNGCADARYFQLVRGKWSSTWSARRMKWAAASDRCTDVDGANWCKAGVYGAEISWDQRAINMYFRRRGLPSWRMSKRYSEAS